MNYPLPPVSPDKGHAYPLAPQANLDHLIVVIPHGTTDDIILGHHIDADKKRNDPVFGYPGDNAANAIKNAA